MHQVSEPIGALDLLHKCLRVGNRHWFCGGCILKGLKVLVSVGFLVAVGRVEARVGARIKACMNDGFRGGPEEARTTRKRRLS